MTVSIADLLAFHKDKGTPDDYCPSVNLGELKNLVAERDVLRDVALALGAELEARPVITPGDPDPPLPEDYRRCETTSTLRRPRAECICHTAVDDLGPCADGPNSWLEGADGTCVHCAHTVACHGKPGPGVWLGFDSCAVSQFELGQFEGIDDDPLLPFTPGIPMKKIAKRIALCLAALAVTALVFALGVLLAWGTLP